VVVSEFASPTFMDLTFSITMVVWAAVGGRSSILGACIGAIVINMISAKVSETEGFAEAWKVVIGLIFVLVVRICPVVSPASRTIWSMAFLAAARPYRGAPQRLPTLATGGVSLDDSDPRLRSITSVSTSEGSRRSTV